MSKIVVALGGNAIKSAGQKGTFGEQYENVRRTTEHLAQLAQAGHILIISHGNGPQVGDLLLQHEAAKSVVPPFPMFMCGAQTQGSIGILIQQTLQNALQKLGSKQQVATIITQVEVSRTDSAFQNPTKPVGPFYQKEEEFADQKAKGYIFIADAGRGYRRVVPSPVPQKIVELETIKELVKNGVVTIASGGGGIPVIRNGGFLEGVDAVIDKDLATQVLANALGADIFMVLTDVEKVSLNYKKPEQVDLDRVSVAEAKKYINEGHFAKGSMLPKIEAVLKFLENGGRQAIITHPFKALEALEGKTGSHFVS